jgi:peptidoglycan/xylan/chitin deacetylase (PgdA/CDA1 family)
MHLTGYLTRQSTSNQPQTDPPIGPAAQEPPVGVQPLSIVMATVVTGRRLDTLLRKAESLAAAAGAPSVVVACGLPNRVNDTDFGAVQLIAHGGDGHVGSALLAGALHAKAPRCLFLDELPRGRALVRAHRAPAVGDDRVTVTRLRRFEPGGNGPWLDCDPLYAFAIRLGRHACVARTSLLQLANEDSFEDAHSAYRLASQLRASRMLFVTVGDPPGDAMGHGDDPRAIGCRAAELYAAEPDTLPQGSLGSFRQISRARLMVRRALLGVPGAARAVGAMATRLPSQGAGARLRAVSSDGLFWKGVRDRVDRETWRRIKGEVTILMYHAFGRRGEPASLYVLPRHEFALQLMLLRVLRRRVIPFHTYVSLRQSYALPPARAVVITIDDGYADAYEVAAPLLAARGYPAIVFVVSGRIADHADWPPEGPLRGRPLAGWEALRAGLESGIEVGAHTRTHPRLTQLNDEAAAEEIGGSGRELSSGLGRSVTSFAYPHGDENSRIREMVGRAGFEAACTSRLGKNGPYEPLDRLRRVEIRGEFGLARFILAVMLGRQSVRRVAEAD